MRLLLDSGGRDVYQIRFKNRAANAYLVRENPEPS